jgi:DNA mismatch repair protein MutS
MKSPIDTKMCGELQTITYTTSEKIITSTRIAELCSLIDKSKEWLRSQLLDLFKQLVEEMSTYTFFTAVCNLIAKFDLIHSYACVSYRYGYNRPQLDRSEGNSYLEMKDLRHPIIERLIDTEYIANDVYLGSPLDDDQNKRVLGSLIFGVNASGKTSLTKAVALNTILAQIGCYTSCNLKYRPYSKIITRLTGQDNLLQGYSTFQIEMTELRTMLRQADANTLCCGDELCHGTETASATSLTISTLLYLIEKNATFMFATHMHQIVEVPWIQELSSAVLKISHLDMTYDEQNNILIYNRKLQPGHGLSSYGIMVARALHLPYDFINKSYEILHYIDGKSDKIVETKKSNYCKDLYVESCVVCDKPPNQVEIHSHHIKEQSLADVRGLIGSMHKDVKDNIISLCRCCHTDLHRKGIEFETVQTPNGVLIKTAQN